MTRPPWCDDSNLPRVWCEHCGGSQIGIFDGIPDSVYHADEGSLSSSGARMLLATSPAHFDYERKHGRNPLRAYDIGHAAHGLLLGVGAPVEVLDPAVHGLKADGSPADNPRLTGSWKKAETEARRHGKVPVHVDDWRAVEQMAASVRAHPTAGALLSAGIAEQSIFWRDEATGVLLRARPDWLHVNTTGRLIVVDLKTTASANPGEFTGSASKFGYFAQQAWYLDGIAATWPAVCAATGANPDADPVFVFVVVEKTPPYPTIVAQLDGEGVELGRQLNRRAIETYAECRRTGEWPAYGDGLHYIALNSWTRKQQEELLA